MKTKVFQLAQELLQKYKNKALQTSGLEESYFGLHLFELAGLLTIEQVHCIKREWSNLIMAKDHNNKSDFQCYFLITDCTSKKCTRVSVYTNTQHELFLTSKLIIPYHNFTIDLMSYFSFNNVKEDILISNVKDSMNTMFITTNNLNDILLVSYILKIMFNIAPTKEYTLKLLNYVFYDTLSNGVSIKECFFVKFDLNEFSLVSWDDKKIQEYVTIMNSRVLTSEEFISSVLNYSDKSQSK